MEQAELAEELAHPAPEEDRRTLPWGAEKSCSLRACAWLFTQKMGVLNFLLFILRAKIFCLVVGLARWFRTLAAKLDKWGLISGTRR